MWSSDAERAASRIELSRDAILCVTPDSPLPELVPQGGGGVVNG
ncbi:hypothetical protein ACG7TL_000108 [Trametes sanguinea]